MANRKNVHVVQRDDGWGTLREGGQRATQVYETKAQAIQAGRQMAKQGQGELLIHGEAERIRARDSYGTLGADLPAKQGLQRSVPRHLRIVAISA